MFKLKQRVQRAATCTAARTGAKGELIAGHLDKLISTGNPLHGAQLAKFVQQKGAPTIYQPVDEELAQA